MISLFLSSYQPGAIPKIHQNVCDKSSYFCRNGDYHVVSNVKLSPAPDDTLAHSELKLF